MVAALLFSSCSSVSLKTVNSSLTFNKKTTLTITNDEDPIGSIRDLNALLNKAGFHTTSMKNAYHAIKHRTPLKGSDINQDLEKAFNIKDINNVYGITLSYRYFKNTFGYSYKNFKYTVINLNTGETVMYGYSSIPKSKKYTKTLEKLVEKLKTKLSA